MIDRGNTRRGFTRNGPVFVLGSLALAAALVAGLYWLPHSGRGQSRSPGGSDTGSESLLVYCAAGIQPPVARIADQFRDEYGGEIQLQYGGSGTLLSNLQVAKTGDLYIAADRSYMDLACDRDLVAEVLPLAALRPVIAVAKGNPKNIRSLDDLLQKDVRLAWANPDAASIGAQSRETLRANGRWQDVEAAIAVLKPTVNDVANDVKLGSADAGIVWDATARQYPELEAVSIPELDGGSSEVCVGVLKSSANPTAALRFARFLSARDRGQPEFAKAGFEPIEGDKWAWEPELVVYSGGVNRVALEPILQAFESREGVKVTRIYNGCGILVAQIKAGQRPDAYFACDTSFIPPVADWFGPPVDVSETDIVMLVEGGNPHQIVRLADLKRPGLKVGVTNPEQSALGAMFRKILEQQGWYEPVMANVTAQTPTADLLVNQMLTGALDVAVVFAANTVAVKDKLTVVPIELPAAKAVQPYVIGTGSDYKFLSGRLLDALRSTEGKTRFVASGFRNRQESNP